MVVPREAYLDENDGSGAGYLGPTPLDFSNMMLIYDTVMFFQTFLPHLHTSFRDPL